LPLHYRSLEGNRLSECLYPQLPLLLAYPFPTVFTRWGNKTNQSLIIYNVNRRCDNCINRNIQSTYVRGKYHSIVLPRVPLE
jgi:hypothetical protein